jgi:hypothetical protein
MGFPRLGPVPLFRRPIYEGFGALLAPYVIPHAALARGFAFRHRIGDKNGNELLESPLLGFDLRSSGCCARCWTRMDTRSRGIRRQCRETIRDGSAMLRKDSLRGGPRRYVHVDRRRLIRTLKRRQGEARHCPEIVRDDTPASTGPIPVTQ